MKTAAELRQLVTRIDHRSYPAYKDTKGMYQFPGYLLSIDHVQGDPFAAPSRYIYRWPEEQYGFRKNYMTANIKRRRCRLSAAKFCKAAGTAFVSGTWFRKKRNYSGDEMWSGSAGTYGV